MRWEAVKPSLKRCCHCKSPAGFVFRRFRNTVGVYVKCKKCGMMTMPRLIKKDYESEFEAAREWNRRA